MNFGDKGEVGVDEPEGPKGLGKLKLSADNQVNL